MPRALRPPDGCSMNSLPRVGRHRRIDRRPHRRARSARPGLRGRRVRAFGDRAGSTRGRHRAASDDHPVLRHFERDGRRHGRDRAALAAVPLGERGNEIYRERMNYRFSSWNTIYRGLVQCFDESLYHLGCEVAEFAQDDREVTVGLSDGTAHTFDLLVCADGISSGTRARLLPRARARYAGYVAWRATVPESELSRRASRRSAIPSPTACCPPDTSSSIPSRASTAPWSPAAGWRTSSGITTTKKATRSTT